jgi:hypothetical protein
LAGAPDGYKYDTINFYEGEYFMGGEQYLYGDAASLNYDNFGRYFLYLHFSSNLVFVRNFGPPNI